CANAALRTAGRPRRSATPTAAGRTARTWVTPHRQLPGRMMEASMPVSAPSAVPPSAGSDGGTSRPRSARAVMPAPVSTTVAPSLETTRRCVSTSCLPLGGGPAGAVGSWLISRLLVVGAALAALDGRDGVDFAGPHPARRAGAAGPVQHRPQEDAGEAARR